MGKRRSTVSPLHTMFYRWFERVFPQNTYLIDSGHTRADMRAAYISGYQRGRKEAVKRISLEPDADMRWIYDPSHRDYNTDRAKHLREARSRAIANAPEWMRREAYLNDLMRRTDGATGEKKP